MLAELETRRNRDPAAMDQSLNDADLACIVSGGIMSTATDPAFFGLDGRVASWIRSDPRLAARFSSGNLLARR